ncbi:MAG TPA: tetratricopeptide repeat protein, partial [Candidatus Ozemobacteraceae bacterium]|nr:tetratricopeptide repeat protein [Candidatus Ozemobacteraceae bacterium]
AQSLEHAVKLAPDEDDCRKALGSIYIQFAKDQKQAGNRERMIDFLHKACIAHPQNTPVWMTLFELWSIDRRWQSIADAAQILKQGNQVALESGDDEKLQKALILAAKACTELRDHPRARDYLTQAGRIKVPNDELLRLRSQLSQQSTQVASNLFGEGKAAFNAGNFKLAMELLGKAQSSEPNNSEIANLIDQAQKRLAMQDFTTAADVAEKQGNWEVALEQVNRALEFSEGDALLSARAASLSACIERKAEADVRAKAAAMARKQSQLAQNQKLATVLKAAEESEKKRAYDAALISYQQALDMAKGDPDIIAAVERTRAAAAESTAHLDHYKTRFSEAMRKLDEEKPDEAFAVFKELSEDSLNPQAELLPHLLKTSVQMERWDEASKYLDKLAATASESDYIEYYTGLLAFQRGEYAAAKAPLTSIQKRNPGFAPDIGSMLWKIWFEKYKWGIYLTLFFILLKLFRPLLSFLSSVKESRTDAAIDSALSNGRYDKAIPLLEARLADDEHTKNRKQLLISLADAYLRQGRPADAIARAAEIAARDSKNPMAQRILGEASFKLGDHTAEGLERILNLYKLDENRRDVLSFLVTQFRASRQESKAALELLSRQLQVSPDDSETVFYLADLYEKRQNFSAATLKVFERAARFAPDSS